MVAVRGPAGIGKSALLEQASECARAAGLAVLKSSGTELEREIAFGVVRQLLEGPLQRLAEDVRSEVLQGAAALAAPVVLEPEPSPRGPEAGHAAMHGLYWLAVEWAARQPLLLVVDDAHWADAASLRWLAYLGRRVDGVPLLVLIASREHEPATDVVLLDLVCSETEAEVLWPRPLTEEGVAHWLADAYGRTPAPRFARACWTATGGNPFLLRELATSLQTEGIPPEAVAATRVAAIAPVTLARAVLLRLAPLGPEAVAISEAVAVLSTDARVDRVAALAHVTVERAEELIDRLGVAGILTAGDPPRFTHPVVRAAVYEQTPSRRRALAHLASAQHMLEDGETPERVAPHLLLAPTAKRAWVVETLRAAAASASARGAPETAVTLLRRALAEPPDERAGVLLELATAEATVHAPEAVEHARQAVEGGANAAQAARAAIIAAGALTLQRRFQEAMAVMAQIQPELASLETGTRHEVEAELLVVSGWNRGIAGYDERLSSLGVDAMRGDTPGQIGLLALRVVQLVLDGRHARDAGLDLAQRLLARVDPRATADDYVLYLLGRSLALADALDQSREFLDQVIDEGRARGAVARVAISSVMRAETELRAGRLREAESDAREALQLSEEYGIEVAVPAALAHLVEIQLDREPAHATVETLARHQLDGDERPLGYGAQLLRHARGRARVAAGDLRGGVEDLRSLGDALTSWGDRNPANLAWRSRLALALAAHGEDEEARLLADEEVHLAQRFGASRAIGIALRAQALLERGSRQIAVLEDAVDALATGPARLELARALLDLGAALRRAGKRIAARDVLAQALEEGVRCGAHQLTAITRAELRAAGARPRRERLSGPDALTASERRVAELAAQGLTNRQIAQALFVTTKTVEMHLGRAYPKLGIHRREQLPTALAAGGLTPSRSQAS